jgi:hypothetical protein
LEVVSEDSLQIILRVDGVFLKALQPYKWSSLQGHREVGDLGGVGAARNFYGLGVTPDPLLESLLVVVLSDADRFEALRVLVLAESACERWEVITVTWYAVAISCN